MTARVDVPTTPAAGPFRRGLSAIGEFLVLVGIVCCLPFVILAIGTPIALAVRLVWWVAGMFWRAAQP